MISKFVNFTITSIGTLIVANVGLAYSVYRLYQKNSSPNNYNDNDNNLCILKDTQYYPEGIRRPLKGTQTSAGWDLYANETITIEAGKRKLVSTGWSLFGLPTEYYLRIAPRSGLACKGIDIGAGVVDSDYRGELKVLVINNSNTDFTIQPTDRIAQLIPEYCGRLDLLTVNENKSNVLIQETTKATRGSGGFGSTN